jgi:hypothetical protein
VLSLVEVPLTLEQIYVALLAKSHRGPRGRQFDEPVSAARRGDLS